ncbi:MAG: ATP phosphoribosyltransferase regulatory subunit [Myxococcales bacterium]|nr:ATP phosphoribosyltransferase regulatory subunit [Myxococcales bacterium]
MSRLEHILPSGTRDHLPQTADALYQLRGGVLSQMRRWGYRRILTPTFEFSDVIRRGVGDASVSLLQFVDPPTGQVLALRPDITPQVARVVATRLRDVEGPLRLCYYGHVFRLESHGGFARREILQAGAELFGATGPDADAEVIALGLACLDAQGLGSYKIDIGDVELGRLVLRQLQLSDAQQAVVQRHLAAKSRSGLEVYLRSIGTPAADQRLLVDLCELYGDRSTLEPARRLLQSDEARARLDYLEQVLDALDATGAGATILLDFGEVRGWDYYTGLLFSVLLPGTGDPLLTGGRYDNLVEGYGPRRAATGFALDLERLQEALDRQGAATTDERPTLLVCDAGAGRREQLQIAAGLRRAGYIAIAPLIGEGQSEDRWRIDVLGTDRVRFVQNGGESAELTVAGLEQRLLEEECRTS